MTDGTLKTAIRAAYNHAPMCVGWRQKDAAWVVYDPSEGAPADVEPEFFIARSGTLPVPLSDDAREVLLSYCADLAESLLSGKIPVPWSDRVLH